MDVSKLKINEEFIGHIFYNSEKNILHHLKIIKTIRESEFEIFCLANRPNELCDLMNNTFVSASWEDSNLVLMDSNYNIVKSIDQYDGKRIRPNGLAINDKNELFISDCTSHQIIVTDLELNKIKTFGSHGTLFDQFNNPAGICFHKNGDLYVCDENNKRVQVFDNDLNFKTSINLNYSPWSIKTSNCCVFITNNPTQVAYVYDLENWKLKTQHEIFLGRLNAINFNIYGIGRSQTLYCFNSYGDLIEKVDIQRIKQNQKHLTYLLLFSFNKTIMFYDPNKKCIKFK